MKERHHIAITGTGRAGTTLLVKILTRLGLPTGFGPDHRVNRISKAGMEHNLLRDDDVPYIVKSPVISGQIDRILARGDIVFDHVIICVRRLHDAAESRRRVRLENLKIGRETGPGSVYRGHDPEKQEVKLAESFHKLIDHLVEAEVPMTFLHFPKFASDVDYFVRQIRHPFPGLLEADVRAAFEAEVRLEWINDFSATRLNDIGEDVTMRTGEAGVS